MFASMVLTAEVRRKKSPIEERHCEAISQSNACCSQSSGVGNSEHAMVFGSLINVTMMLDEEEITSISKLYANATGSTTTRVRRVRAAELFLSSLLAIPQD